MKSNRVITGHISSPFGMRIHPIDKSRRIHQGIDVSAPTGTPIYSPCNGWVSAIYNHHSGGLTLVLGTAQGEVRYGMCHLQSIAVEVGQSVEAGQFVAYSGNSGRSTGPHLHFSVKTGGNWVDNQYIGGQFVDSAPYLDIR